MEVSPQDIEEWLSDVKQIETKHLTMQEIETFDKWAAADDLGDADSVFDFEHESLHSTARSFRDSVLKNSVSERGRNHGTRSCSIQTIIGDASHFLLQEARDKFFNQVDQEMDFEIPMLSSGVQDDGGIHYYEYGNPHAMISKILLPRSFGKDEDEVEDDGFCEYLDCQRCADHQLLRQYHNVVFPMDKWLHLYPRVITQVSAAEFRCAFCAGTRRIPFNKKDIHLHLAHGIKFDPQEQHFTLIAHPKALFEQLTSKGFFSSCLCEGCQNWITLCGQGDEYAGYFTSYFNHAEHCPAVITFKD